MTLYWTGMKSVRRYSITIKRSAARELQRVPLSDRTRVPLAIDRLAHSPMAGSPLKGGLKGIRRLRVGDYRVLYEVKETALVVLVVRVAHRRDAYRRPVA